MNIHHAHGQLTAPGEVRFVRNLPPPIERIWEYLTDPAKRSRWLAGGRLEPRAGGENYLEFHNTKLSGQPETIPAKYAADCQDGCGFTGRITRWEPPRVLAHTWPESDGTSSEVTFELTESAGQVTLVLTHRRLGENRDVLLSVAAGWHTHLEILAAKLAGSPPPPFWSTHTRLEAEYAQLIPVPAPTPAER
jgi:uncharacterized protein YndB with AHSA1/START domain